jgi:hypothetical protein
MAEIGVCTVAPRKDDPPFTPFANIWLSQRSADSEGRILLSPQLRTDREIDESVDRLIEQLETVRKKAKKELRETKEKLRDSMEK